MLFLFVLQFHVLTGNCQLEYELKLKTEKEFKRKETNKNVSTSKENKDKIINNKETKDKAFNGKVDDKTSKSKGTIKRPFSELDTVKNDSPKKKKTNSNKFKGGFLYKVRFNSE